jgi:hypothetical protein
MMFQPLIDPALRDNIAVAAMREILRDRLSDPYTTVISREVASESYRMADAMLAARSADAVTDEEDPDPDHDSGDETTYTEHP